MNWHNTHADTPNTSFDGGDLDCGNGLLLLIRKHLDPLKPGQLLEIRSTESSVVEDLPAWCRLTSNDLVSATKNHRQMSFLIRKNPQLASSLPASAEVQRLTPKPMSALMPAALTIEPLSVMGIGSWPRPRWLMNSLQDYLEGRLSEDDFQQTADDAVRLAISAQERAGVGVITDGEQRRDSYASFVGSRLEGTQLVPITDLLPYVDDPAKFAEELKALDIPAEKVRHPAVLKTIARKQALAAHEALFARSVTALPVKVALPGPYLLTRTLWMECVTDKPYPTREPLAEDVVKILRAEIAELLQSGTALIQFDEPVLTEVVFGSPQKDRKFMCGALSERKDPQEELEFAGELLRRVLDGFPRERLAMHVCRGNWSKDESVALAGDYRPLLPLFSQVPVGTLFLELSTPRAGELQVLEQLPTDVRVGVGLVNQKLDDVEPIDLVRSRAQAAVDLFGAQRVLFTPDCGFATFADNPLASAAVAEAKLAVMAQVAREFRDTWA